MTVLEVIQRSTDFLAKRGVESPRLQVELALAHVLRQPRLNLYLNFGRILDEAELETVRGLVKRRGNREPLQHLLGSTSFCGFEIKVNPQVLIPRPETEQLAERGWTFLQARAASGGHAPLALDFGTGSGCLAIALAAKCPAAIIHAVDISAEALATARENTVANQVADRVVLHHGDGFAVLPAGPGFDLVVSNPPYIPGAEIATLDPEVRDHDPRLALDGGPDGLDFYRRLATEAAARLRPGGCLMIEFGDGQAAAIAEIFGRHNWVVAGTEADYSGRQRLMTLRPPAV